MLKKIVLKKILTAVIFPLSIFTLISSWFVYHLLKNTITKKIKYIFISVFIFFILITMQPMAGIFINSLENDFVCLIDTTKIKEAEYIIILGGGYSDAENMPTTSQLGSSSLLRLVEGIRLKRINPNAKLIFSGGKPFTEKYSEASIYESAYKNLTSDTSKQILSEIPHNTKSEADETYKLIGNKKLILVTSANHMKRAVYLFEQMGCNIIPAPCDFLVKNIKYYPALPSWSSIKQTEYAIHEYIGILRYKIIK
jgi:uncharacterized SAM-binding protein YcdF (DUF218 family)